VIDTQYETIPMQHAMFYADRVEPTDKRDGTLAYYNCTVCNKYFLDENGEQEVTANDLAIHYPDTPKQTNAKVETDNRPASFELVTCCKHDGTELSRETVILEMHPAKEATLEEDGNIKYYTDDAGNQYVYNEESKTFKKADEVATLALLVKETELVVGSSQIWIPMYNKIQIIAYVLPENATFKEVTFTVEDPSILSVDEDGNLTPLSLGETNVIVSSHHGLTKTIPVVVRHGHIAGETQYEDVTIAPTCVTPGLGMWVEYCAECGAFMSKSGPREIPATGMHLTELVPAREPSEEADGCKEHYICTSCNGLFNDEEATVPTTKEKVTLHFADEPKIENSKPETNDQPASFELVIYCKHDGTELDRKTVTLEMHPAVEASLLGDGNVKYYTDEDDHKYIYDGETDTFKPMEDITVPFVPIAVEKLNVNETEVALLIGETFQLETTVEPADATLPQVIFTSTDESVAEVNPLGLITAKGEGTATIECVTADGAAVTVTVTIQHRHNPGEPKIEDVSKEPTCCESGIGELVTRCTICGEELDREKNVTIPATGKHLPEAVEARDASEEADGNQAYYRCATCEAVFMDEKGENETTMDDMILHFADVPKQENVKPETGDLPASFECVIYCKHDGTELSRETITLTVHPAKEATPTEDGNIMYYTDDDGNKYVYDEDSGTFTESADVSTQFPVVPVSDIKLNAGKVELRDGDTFQLIVTVQPEDATFKAVAFSSSDDTIISVDENGLIMALNPGTATITCTADGKQVTVTITVEHKHISGEPKLENITKEPTCCESGIGDLVTRCTICGEELDREKNVTIPATGKHTPDDGTRVNEIKGTCETEGSYVLIVKCTDCGEELSSKTVSTGFGAHNWNDGDVKSGKYDKYTVTEYTCQHCGQHKTEQTRNPNYQFRCKRCDWFDARKDTKGVLGLIYKMIHDITHSVQHINALT